MARAFRLAGLTGFLAIGVLSTTGCGGDSKTTAPSPVISTFYATRSPITAGEAVSLVANFTNGEGSINQGVGAVKSGVPVTVAPQQDTAYQLTVSNGAGGQVTSTFALKVAPQPVAQIQVSQRSVTEGADLTASVPEQAGCTYQWSVSRGVLVSSPTSRVVTVNAGTAGTMTLTCTVTNAAGKSHTDSTDVSVYGIPRIVSFMASSQVTTAGTPVLLTAVYTGGNGVLNTGQMLPSGQSVFVTPLTDTQYTLTVTGASWQTATASVTVRTTAQASGFGVVALNNVGTVGILDARTQSLSSVRFTDELGTIGGGLFDVAISPDGRTTLVTNFGDAKVFFLDTSNPAAPALLGSVTTSYFDTATPPVEHMVFAEDITFTPDGRFALVTDGGFNPHIFVIDVAARKVVEVFNDSDPQAVPPISRSHQAVAVAADGRTVLTVDYFGSLVNVFTLSNDGHLTFVKNIDVSFKVEGQPTVRPVNVTISPDGRTAIVASATADLLLPVLNIAGPGQVTLSDLVVPTTVLKGSQSVVFNPAGTKAYVMCTQPMPDPLPEDPKYPGPKNVIRVLNVTGPGKASDAGVSIEVEVYGRSQLFGVDTLAMDGAGKYLYVSNPTVSGAKGHIPVVDLTTNTVIKNITFSPIKPASESEPLTPLPTGICFSRN